jgi:hypothetical protein
MCHSSNRDNQQSRGTNNWEEEARAQNQLYPDLSEFFDSVFASANPTSTSQAEQEQRQSTWRNIFNLFANNGISTPPNNSENQQNAPSAPPPDTTQEGTQNSTSYQAPQGSTAYSRQENHQDFSQYRPRNPPPGMPWNYQYQDYYNMQNGAYNDGVFFNNRPYFPPLLATFFVRCVQASAKLTGLILLLLFLFCVPQTMMAIGLAVAVIHSITRIPIFPLIGGSIFLCFLLYLDSQLLMLLSTWAIFKCIVMGKPLMNREYWRRCYTRR